MTLLELLGRRWMLRILWELREPATSFRQLQESCDGMSSSVLADRLAQLDDADIVRASPGGGYRLTEEGERLAILIAPLDAWARRWSERAGE